MDSRKRMSLYSEVGNYVFQTEKLHDVHFFVGPEKERIGAARSFLINQSETWWSLLSEDCLFEGTNNIALPNVEPAVFILLLKHSYGGLNDLSSLPTKTVVKLCVCANKYTMTTLMKKIASRLQPKTVNELFPALYCMLNYNLQDVQKQVKEIVQKNTTQVFSHPEFLESDVKSVTYITMQDCLDCEEIDVWNAVFAWARNKARSNKAGDLRQWMSPPLQHIRLLVVDPVDLFRKVFTTSILKSSEIYYLCNYYISQIKTICNKASPRGKPKRKLTYKEVYVGVHQNVFTNNEIILGNSLQDKLFACIVVKDESIYLQSITCRVLDMYFRAKLYEQKNCPDVSITISQITDPITNTSNERPFKMPMADFTINYFDYITIPIGFTLQANNKYKIELYCRDECFSCLQSPSCQEIHEFDHGTFYCSLTYNDGIGTTPCFITQFTYCASVKTTT